SSSETMIALYNEDWQLSSNVEVKVILLAWSDGCIVWSANSVFGGPPYHCGRISGEGFKELVGKLGKKGWFGDASLQHPNLGFDMAFTTLLVKDGARELRMESSHTMLDENITIAMYRRIRAINGRVSASTLNDLIRYLHYRLVWDSIQGSINRL